ncbi:hypothetical protein CROQUDRAFT_660494 [Cronartium quercuum f. sp. fusiforme G11]|uniref:Macrofage activating glycoprotein n=1 Tax=Cronartium quercuum f. sp. fusiforme G11 TaxID=708437 RepID=A0A9P6T9C6_9BASI|nr:hypothetical protein CROQUDRAFT_660494 [Cronartium quercuum f. sp. fusiforme G11]
MWAVVIPRAVFLCVFFTTKFNVVRSASKPNWPDPKHLPKTTEPGQFGYNNCGSKSSQTSNCQTLYVNSLTDFCIWAPPSGQQRIGDSEEYEVAWCTKSGHGTRQIPAGALRSAHFLSTPHYIQISGAIDGPALNIQKNDEGGELDPHGATGLGNPIGSLVYTTAFGKGVQQVKEWMNFMGDGEFCFRICNPRDPNAWLYCQHIYDVMGCTWVMPGNYGGGFDSCLGDSMPPPGVYGASTFHQGDAKTPAPHRQANSSSCKAIKTVGLLQISGNATSSSASISTITRNGTDIINATSTANTSSVNNATNTTNGVNNITFPARTAPANGTVMLTSPAATAYSLNVAMGTFLVPVISTTLALLFMSCF